MRLIAFTAVLSLAMLSLLGTHAKAQRVQFPSTGPAVGVRPIAPDGQRPMVPISPQSNVLPPAGSPSYFDPYATSSTQPVLPLNIPPLSPGASTVPAPAGFGQQYPGTFPNYNGPAPTLPGTGQSAIVGSYPNNPITPGAPGIYPNSSPNALYPAMPGAAYSNGPGVGSFFNDVWTGVFGSGNQGFGGTYAGGNVIPPGGGAPTTWNPQGSVFSGGPINYPPVLRFFQGPRFRHAWIAGNDDADALMINDSDVSLAFAIPNFFYSTQPLFLLPSFSLHNWDGPHPNATADLPPIAYSAFLDAGWQSDPNRILGAELGLRVGMFSDFDTATSDSLRIMGRGIGRIRLTPRATLKLGVMYLDRNRIKLLPAGGLLWQPNQDTRFDLFFPEPKLAHYLSTVGTADTWWYVGGYYGGGSWTIQRANNTDDSIDINDLRLVLGIEWGKNELMRQGRRAGFIEVGYIFDRELLYENSPADNLSLQDSVIVRAGFGY